MVKTNTGLVEYAKAQLGLPYWYGTFGLTATADLYKAKREQYPQYYRSWSDFPTQYGKRVHDCVGLIKGYLWSDTPTSKPKYNSAQDVSANGMLSKCKVSGTMGTMPDIPGILVFMPGHVGVYIGGGKVVEARGHEYGVVLTKLTARPWKHWGKCPWISYIVDDDSEDGIKLRVKAGKWNVRTGCSTSHQIVCVVSGGTILTAGKQDSGWYYIPALRGWISPKAVEIV